MASTRKVALIVTLVAGLGAGAAALAHGPGMGFGPGPGGAGCAFGGMGPGGPWSGANAEEFAKFQDGRLAALKERLKITAEQEAAWSAFAAQAKEHRPGAFGPPAGATGPERFAARTEHMKQRVAEMEKMQAAYKQLYDVLSPAQRELLGGGFEPRGGRWS